MLCAAAHQQSSHPETYHVKVNMAGQQECQQQCSSRSHHTLSTAFSFRYYPAADGTDIYLFIVLLDTFMWLPVVDLLNFPEHFLIRAVQPE